MKMLYVIRHAKSSWEDPFLKDFDRPLNHRGIKDAPKMARRLHATQVVPHLFITSPANRALTTCEIFAQKFSQPLHAIRKLESLYHANEEKILHVVQQIDDAHNVVFLFGHNPGLTDFVNALCNERLTNIPTCGIAGCSAQVKSWKEIRFGASELFLFDYPKAKE